MISFSHLRGSLVRRLISGLLFFHSIAFLAAQDSAAAQTQTATATFRIAGVVVSSTGGNPLAHARVTIINDKNPERRQSMVTGEDGRFEFKVGAGKYALQGNKRGYIAAAYEQHEQFSTAIVTGAGLDTENLALRLAPAAVLSGKILDESGDPVRHAMVSLYREDRRVGIGRILKTSADSTDDQGAYEFSSLDAGTYFISVTAKPWYANHPRSSEQGSAESETDSRPSSVDRSLDVAYPITYFGDSTEPDDATPIPIRGGDHLQADIHLNPVPALHLLFRVAENSERGINVPMLQRPAFDGVDTVQTDGMQQVSPGVFEINGVAPGRYSVRTPGSGDGNEANEINLTNDGQELNVAGAEAGGNIKATVQLAGETKLPQHLGIALRNSKMRVVAWQEVDAKSELEFQDVAPGKYEVLAFAQPKEYSVVENFFDRQRNRGTHFDRNRRFLAGSFTLAGRRRSKCGRIRQARGKSGAWGDGGVGAERSGIASRLVPQRPKRSGWKFQPAQCRSRYLYDRCYRKWLGPRLVAPRRNRTLR